jgi:hypothetical protein
MTTTIDGPRALQLLRDVVRGRENHVDPGALTGACAYGAMDDESNPTPGCIVGHAVYATGLPLRVLDLMDNLGSVNSVYGSLEEFKVESFQYPHIRSVVAELSEELSLTRDATAIFSSAQGVQDNAGTWGEALFAAEESFNRIYNTEELDQR